MMGSLGGEAGRLAFLALSSLRLRRRKMRAETKNRIECGIAMEYKYMEW